MQGELSVVSTTVYRAQYNTPMLYLPTYLWDEMEYARIEVTTNGICSSRYGVGFGCRQGGQLITRSGLYPNWQNGGQVLAPFRRHGNLDVPWKSSQA